MSESKYNEGNTVVSETESNASETESNKNGTAFAKGKINITVLYLQLTALRCCRPNANPTLLLYCTVCIYVQKMKLTMVIH